MANIEKEDEAIKERLRQINNKRATFDEAEYTARRTDLRQRKSQFKVERADKLFTSLVRQFETASFGLSGLYQFTSRYFDKIYNTPITEYTQANQNRLESSIEGGLAASYCSPKIARDYAERYTAELGKTYILQLIRFARVCNHVTDVNARNKCLTAKLLQQGYRHHKLRNTFSKFYRRHYELISKYNDGLKTLLSEGLSEPEFYGDLVNKFKTLIGSNDFSFQFRKIVTRYRRIGYNLILL